MSEFFGLTQETADKVVEWRDDGGSVATAPNYTQRAPQLAAFIRTTGVLNTTTGLHPAEVVFLDSSLNPVVLGTCQYRDLNAKPLEVGTSAHARFAGNTSTSEPIYAGDALNAAQWEWLLIDGGAVTTPNLVNMLMRPARKAKTSKGTTSNFTNLDQPVRFSDADCYVFEYDIGNTAGSRLERPTATWLSDTPGFPLGYGAQRATVWPCELWGYYFNDGRPVYCHLSISTLSNLSYGVTESATSNIIKAPSQGDILYYQVTGNHGYWVRLPIGTPCQVLTVAVGTDFLPRPMWMTPGTCSVSATYPVPEVNTSISARNPLGSAYSPPPPPPPPPVPPVPPPP